MTRQGYAGVQLETQSNDRSARFIMRQISIIITATVVLFAAVFFVFATRQTQAAPNVTTGSCPRLTATPYVLAGTSMGGNHYVIMVASEDCTQVEAWVKKILAQHISGPPDDTVPFKGGPAGYTCTASPDGRGHPYQGGCQKNSNKNIGFSWTMGG